MSGGAFAGMGQAAPVPGRIFAIDPGPTKSAYVLLEDGRPVAFAKLPNDVLLDGLRGGFLPLGLGQPDIVVIEWITVASVAGAEVYDTCRWVGRFQEAVRPLPAELLSRMDVLNDLFGRRNVPKADALVRRAMLDRFGGDGAKGTKSMPGPLHGFAADCWAALAVAIVWADREANTSEGG